MATSGSKMGKLIAAHMLMDDDGKVSADEWRQMRAADTTAATGTNPALAADVDTEQQPAAEADDAALLLTIMDDTLSFNELVHPANHIAQYADATPFGLSPTLFCGAAAGVLLDCQDPDQA